MKRIVLLTLCLIALISFTQEILGLNNVKPDGDYENVWVHKVADDENQTGFVIWVKDSVRLHKHEHHTENIYVLGGKGEMYLADEKFVIKKGDYFNIPKNTPHGLKVLSSSPIRVLSIQSPKFVGKDRIFLD